MIRRQGLFTSSALIGVAFGMLACGGQGPRPGAPEPTDQVGIGFGTQDEDATTGAITSVTDDDLGQMRPQSVEELLRGRVPGLQVLQTESGVTFRIRGAAGSVLDNEPLFVLDGVSLPIGNVEQALMGLTREDIERVDVLKDVASTSIYGQRGSGGVIVITTAR